MRLNLGRRKPAVIVCTLLMIIFLPIIIAEADVISATGFASYGLEHSPGISGLPVIPNPIYLRPVYPLPVASTPPLIKAQSESVDYTVSYISSSYWKINWKMHLRK
ncbi:uncharacterized protein LOC143202181 [Rhynchophorus ferrugineus]|uniref:uncharacterized protein LOC143202181 n=1 Tax=Rhynchophorus ferrugineus TaxID=354439 RepID=UPI003FCCC750